MAFSSIGIGTTPNDGTGDNLRVAAGKVNTNFTDLSDATSATKGSSLVGYLPSGTGASARTVQAKLRDVVSVKDFGAAGDGVTDDTAEIAAAILAHECVYFPAGTYLVSGTLELTDNAYLFGDGIANTVIRQDGTLTSGKGTFYCNSGSSSAFIDSLVLRDLAIDGQVATKTFSEFQHLVSLMGVKDCVIERVKFLGMRGDGLYLGSGLSGTDERHNVNVAVRDCVFDGVNSDNRNGITVIDCDGLTITGNVFRNLSKSTMPGCIDIEPDGNAFHVVKSVNIHDNVIESFGGGCAIGCVIDTALTTPLKSITIRDNSIAGNTKSGAIGIRVSTNETLGATTKPMGILVQGNTITSSSALQPFSFNRVRGITFAENHVIDGSVAAFGDDTTTAVTIMDATLSNNIFDGSGNANGAVQIAGCDGVKILGNVIDAPNAGTATMGIRFVGTGVTTTSKNVNISDNKFIIAGGSMVKAVGYLNHTTTRASNCRRTNVADGGTLTWDYLWDIGDPLEGSQAWNPGAIGDGTGVNQSVTVVGAALGDPCIASFDKDLDGVLISANVPVGDLVEVTLQNETGGSKTPASGTVYVKVFKRA